MDALNTAVASDPHFTLAHCTKAYVGLRMGQVDTALEAHQQALAQQDSVHTEREHLHVQTIDALARNDRATAHTSLEQIVAQHPTDRIALWQLNQMQIAQGNYRGGLALARRTLEACPDEPLFQTMTGVVYSWGRAGIAADIRYTFGTPWSCSKRRPMPDAMPQRQPTR